MQDTETHSSSNFLSSLPSSLSRRTNISEEEEAECRVCRGEAEEDRRLIAPCKCSGSIRYTHSDCLEQWLLHSGKKICELCRYEFKFIPIYDADTPTVLPWSHMTYIVAKCLFLHWIPFSARFILVFVLWVGFAPWCTSWLYRMWLLRASAMTNVSLSQRLQLGNVLEDVYAGIIIMICITGSFLSLISFAEFWKAYLEHARDIENNVGHREWINEEDDDAIQERLQVFDNFRIPDDNDWLDRIDEGRLADVDPVVQGAVVDNFAEDQQNDEDIGWNQPPAVQPEIRDGPPVLAGAPRPREGRRRLMGNLEDDVEHMEINIALEEVLGVRGSLLILFRNVSWFLAFNGAYLGLFAFIPFTLGSAILSAMSKILSFFPLWSTFIPMLTLSSGTPASTDMVLDSNHLWNLASIGRELLVTIDKAQVNGDCIQLVDLCTCAVGYASICFTILLWRVMVSTISSYVHRPIMGGLLWVLQCLGALSKVSLLLIIKMVVLPTLLGLGIGFSTLQVSMTSVEDRIMFIIENKMEAFLLHWAIGITFMLFVTVYVLQLREVLHPAILAASIRPQEAQTDLLKTLLKDSCAKHTRKIFISVAIYAVLLTVLVYLPVQAVHTINPAWFPLTLRFQHYCRQVQVPLELMVFHITALAILEYTKNHVGHYQHVGLKFMCNLLGLTEYLLPRIKVDEVDASQFVQCLDHEEFVLAPPPLHFHPQAVAPPERLRIKGRRYYPWAEDNVEDSAPIEYTLLERPAASISTIVRLICLLAVCSVSCIVLIAASILSPILLGRRVMGPFERMFGIAHEPVSALVGLTIVWFLVHSISALHVLLLPRERIKPALLERGYCVKHLWPSNAAVCVIAWVFFCPMLIGYALAACLSAARATIIETYWMGFFFLNLTAWFICCCMQHDRNPDVPQNPQQPRNEVVENPNEEEDAALREQPAINAHGAAINPDEIDHHLLQNRLLGALQLSYKQLQINLSAHDDSQLRIPAENISSQCLDLLHFRNNVLIPILTSLIISISSIKILALILSIVSTLCGWNVNQYAFAISAITHGFGLAFVRCNIHASRWLANMRDRMRNEQYLVGRQLQDRAR